MLAYLDTLIGFAVVMLGASLIITILTQMASALLSHRGANLKWGLEMLFRHIPGCPLLNDAKRAEMMARDVLSHPLISDSIFSIKLPIPVPQWIGDRFKLATAIDPDELVAILKDLAGKPAYQAIEGLPAEINALVSERNPAVDRRLNLLTGTPSLAALPILNAVPLLQDALEDVQDEAGKLEAWFNATMDRVSTRFTTYARLWTVAFAVALAFVTGLNTVSVLNTLYTNGDFRQQLTGAGAQLMDAANRVVPQASADVAVPLYTGLMGQALQASGVTPDNPPKSIASEGDAEQWIATHVKPEQQPAVQKAFGTAYLNERSQDAAAVRAMLTKSGFDITQFRWAGGKPSWPQVPGVLATAALLSLGAPFWFNLLKQVTNLRPILAAKQDSGS